MKKPKHHMTPAGRKKIAEIQRARWAKLKADRKAVIEAAQAEAKPAVDLPHGAPANANVMAYTPKQQVLGDYLLVDGHGRIDADDIVQMTRNRDRERLENQLLRNLIIDAMKR